MAERTDDDASSRGGRLGCMLLLGAAAVVLIGSVTAGCLAFTDRFPGDSMDIAWEAPADGKGSEQGNGAWLVGDTLVRSRFDAASGYDARTGERVWDYRPPGRSQICVAEADVDSAVLLVARDDENRPAASRRELCTTVAAIDMKNGREIWRAPLPAPGDDPRFERRLVAAGGGLAVIADKGLRALDVRTGQSRWTAAVPANCVPGKATPAKRRVAAVLACGDPEKRRTDNGMPEDAELHAAAFAPTTGALLWSTPLGDREPVRWDKISSVLSADPVVVSAASDSGDKASGAYYSFGADGRPHPPIDYDGDNGHLDDKLRVAAVDDTRLYALAGYYRKGGTRHRAVAFDLATGELAWKADLDNLPGVNMRLQDGKLTVIVKGSATSAVPDEDLYVLDAATGKERDSRSFHDAVAPADEVFEHKGLLIVARLGGSAEPVFTAYERS
ncbi:PQQ-binding-like beta-propeller repeat protein [Streptomyces sp. NPDC002773]|uniref:PQQ-binding-like beta-propeller repeat protein n=1 Tax=Streptomyces sp. NPDC002773 TaxID=3154430 RepID=UPI00332D342A